MRKVFFFLFFSILCISIKSQIRPTIEWVVIPAGTFIMGSSTSESGREDYEIQHQVRLDAFKMSKYEVTFDQYDAYCEATGKEKPNDEGWGRGNRPVINVSWEDANAFAEWMGCRLPTEAEWEYACRAGSISPFNTGNNLTSAQGNYNGYYPYKNFPSGEFRRKTLPVGSFAANEYGLYDMHGNAGEWCSDWHRNGAYSSTAMDNPKGPSSGWAHVVRGGDWLRNANSCRSASRGLGSVGASFSTVGIRLVMQEN